MWQMSEESDLHRFGAQCEKQRWTKVFVLTRGIRRIRESAEGVCVVRRSEK